MEHGVQIMDSAPHVTNTFNLIIMNFDSRDLSILTQVVYKQLKEEWKSRECKDGFWKDVEGETLQLARTIWTVNNTYQKSLKK